MKRVLSIYVFIVFTFLYLPILILVLFSFNKDRISSSWGGFTTNWYSLLIHNSDLIDSFKTSVTIAFCSALIAAIIGTLTAYALYKFNYRGKKVVQTVLSFPIVTPDIVLGIGLLLLFSFLNFTLGFCSILLAHITFNVSYTTLIVSTRFAYIDRNLEDAAADLGAKPVQAFLLVVVPNIMPGIVASFLIAFTLSWDDFIVAFFNSGIGTTTLPVRVYSMIKKGIDPQINAVSCITLIVSIIAICIALRFQKASKLLSTT